MALTRWRLTPSMRATSLAPTSSSATNGPNEVGSHAAMLLLTIDNSKASRTLLDVGTNVGSAELLVGREGFEPPQLSRVVYSHLSSPMPSRPRAPDLTGPKRG